MSADGYVGSSPFATQVSEVRLDRGAAPPLPPGMPAYVAVVHNGERWIVVTSFGQGANISIYGQANELPSRYWADASVKRVEALTSTAPVVAVQTLAEQVGTLRTCLGITMSDIADWMGVTRPAVYGWLKNVQPQPETARKLAEAAVAMVAVAALKLERPDFVLKRPLFDGQSALDVLRAGRALSSEQLDRLTALDARESDQRRASASGVPARSIRDVLNDSTPLMQR